MVRHPLIVDCIEPLARVRVPEQVRPHQVHAVVGADIQLMWVVEVVEEDAIALVLSTEALSFFAHPARTAAQQQIAMRVVRCGVNIQPPV